MGQITEIVTAGVAASGAIGAAIAFVWAKIEKRFGEIDAQLKECHQRENETQKHRALHLAVIELLWQEVERLAPDAKILKRAKSLLDDLKSGGGME